MASIVYEYSVEELRDIINESTFIKEVQNEWSVSHTQVKRWIRLNYPDFKYYERHKF